MQASAKSIRTPVSNNICKRLLLKPSLWSGSPLRSTYIVLTDLGTSALAFVSQFTVPFTNSSFTTIHTAIIRSRHPLVFCKTSVVKNFVKNHKKTPGPESRFQWSCRSTEFKFIKKRDSATVFFVNFSKFLKTHFSNNPLDDSFCINTSFVCCPTKTFRFFKNDITSIFELSIFSA